MDRDVIEAKLESLRRCLQRLRGKLPVSADDLARDPDLQDVVALNLIRAVQVSADIAAHIVAERAWRIPATMGDGFLLLAEHGVLTTDTAQRMRAAVGFRNIAVHNPPAPSGGHRLEDWRVRSRLQRPDGAVSALSGKV